MWTTLGEIGEIITGNTPSKDNKEYYGGNIPFFKPTDLEQGIDTKFSNDKLSQLGFESSRKLPANTVLVTCIGATIGKTGLISVEGSCNQQINAIVPTKSIIPYFLYYACVSEYMQNEIKSNASATTLPILNKGNFSKIAFPLPPLEEQKRIVSEIERWMLFVKVVESGKSDLQKIIIQAKSKILDLAIHGKLVPQDQNDEPASELLKRINPKAEITCDNPQYGKLPKGWCLCKISSVVDIVNGKSQKNVESPTGKYPIYGSGGIIGKAMEYTCLAGSTIIGRKGTINHPIFVEENFWNVDTAFGMKANNQILEDEYFYCFCLYFDFSKLDKSSALPSLTKTAIGNLILPIPPLAEQQRIVAKIEELFSQLDKIESSLQA